MQCVQLYSDETWRISWILSSQVMWQWRCWTSLLPRHNSCRPSRMKWESSGNLCFLLFNQENPCTHHITEVSKKKKSSVVWSTCVCVCVSTKENASCKHPAVHGLHHQASAGHSDPVVRRLQSVSPPTHHRNQVWDDQADRHCPSDCSGHGVSSPSCATAVTFHSVCNRSNNLFFPPQLPACQINHPQRSEEQQYPSETFH